MKKHPKNLCICGKLKDKRSKFCKTCANLGSRNPYWKNNKSKRKYFCIDCDKEITYESYYNGNKRCHSCAGKGKLSSQYKYGKYCGNNKCKDCGKKISPTAIRCYNCNNKITARKRNFIGKNNPMFGKITHGKWGKYKGIKMRSSYEIAYAKYLDKWGTKWYYEKITFDLGDSTYTPDFYLPKRNTYIEVKGYWRDDAKKKFRLFKKLYPDIGISVLNKKELLMIGALDYAKS